LVFALSWPWWEEEKRCRRLSTVPLSKGHWPPTHSGDDDDDDDDHDDDDDDVMPVFVFSSKHLWHRSTNR
jgi:hypothetical protein